MRRKLRLALYALGDRICARAGAGTDAGVTRPALFALGNRIGEAGWRLREEPAVVITAGDPLPLPGETREWLAAALRKLAAQGRLR